MNYTINYLQKSLCVLLFLSITISSYAQTINWTGAGDGNSWEDPDNWNTGVVPNDQDFVAIDDNSIVSLSTEVNAMKVKISGNASFTINQGGALICPNDVDGDIMSIEDYATLINNGVLSLLGTPSDNAIQISDMGTFDNRGPITIISSSNENILLINNASFISTSTSNLVMSVSPATAIKLDNDASFSNYGFVSFFVEGSTADCIEMRANSTFYNHGSMNLLTTTNASAIDMQGANTLFANYGLIRFSHGSTTTDDCIKVKQGTFINKSTGDLQLFTVQGSSLAIENYGAFSNEGLVSIFSVDDIVINLQSGASLFNSSQMQIINGNYNPVISIKDNSTFINASCESLVDVESLGIMIEIAATGSFANNGILDVDTQGTNINFGTFKNAGQINAIAGFTTAPNPVVAGGAITAPWSTTNIGNSGASGNDFSASDCVGSELSITGGGNNATSTTTDNVAFVSQTLCGTNTSITAKIESLDPNGYAGLMIRESASAGAKQVSIFSNLTNLLRHESRSTTNGVKQVNQFFKPYPVWLRLQRQGDWIFAYYSVDGVTFNYVHAVFVPMNNCVEVGLTSFTYISSQQTTAVFSNVSLAGGSAGFGSNDETPESPSIIQDISSTLMPETSKLTPSLYPNPATDMVNLKFTEALTQDAIVRLMSPAGQVMEQRELRAGDITSVWDVNTLINGMYFLEIQQQGQEVQMLKFVKTH